MAGKRYGNYAGSKGIRCLILGKNVLFDAWKPITPEYNNGILCFRRELLSVNILILYFSIFIIFIERFFQAN